MAPDQTTSHNRHLEQFVPHDTLLMPLNGPLVNVLALYGFEGLAKSCPEEQT